MSDYTKLYILKILAKSKNRKNILVLTWYSEKFWLPVSLIRSWNGEEKYLVIPEWFIDKNMDYVM